jgi:hypothetical protein
MDKWLKAITKIDFSFTINQLTVMRIAALLGYAILLSFLCKAQEKREIPKNRLDNIFKHNHVSFTAATNWIKKAKTESTGGPYQIGSKAMRGWEAGFNYHINFNKSYSLIIGLHGLASPRTHTLFVPKEDFTPPLQEDYVENKLYNKTIDMYFYLPILFEKRWFSKNNNHWNLNAGVAVGFYPDEIYEGWGGWSGSIPQQPVVTKDLLVTSNFKPWMNYMITAGHNWTLSNSNILRVNLQANFTSFSLAKGDYEIAVTGKPISNGTYESRLSGTGISVQYILTSSRKVLVRKYKKELKQRGF